MLSNLLRNYKVMLILGAVFALLTAVAASYEWKKIAGNKDVLVAAVDIGPGVELTAKEIVTKPKNKRDLPQDTVYSITDLQGKAPRGVIPQDTVLRQSMFKPMESFGAEGMLKDYPGRKALAFGRDLDTTVGDQVQSGSRVDIHAIITGAINGAEKKKTVAENVPVLLVTATANTQNKSSAAVVVALTPEEIDKIMLAHAESAKFLFTLLPKN
ncbi:Flp pilus assembly protein CpaB [Desulforamulus ruminis]|uniref:SAF domain protein n=1 Tax=Desulforamulus ruminis (strain ATCC 23193 / DSM 2154 / NCIMB 8452 / DL) TaxID=696281 RepID=F6DTC8_DESRL|nr:RcpC/CpaB family pilus assembly protein [Desulforamulus ruminis]AEG58945.1 SAF domain protein [Desulforamulus ruminis DSM 2154]